MSLAKARRWTGNDGNVIETHLHPPMKVTASRRLRQKSQARVSLRLHFILSQTALKGRGVDLDPFYCVFFLYRPPQESACYHPYFLNNPEPIGRPERKEPQLPR